MKFFREIFFGEEKTFTPRVIFFHALILSASVAFLYLFSYSTSPRYETFGDDSAIFQAVGKGWTEGLLPYVDMFENKGPLIFLIDAVGYMIYPRVGIFLLQIPAMYFAMLFAWRALGIFLSGKAKFAAAIFMLIYYAFYSLDGNRTEEWSMPLLMAATYLFLRGLKEKNFSCPPYVGFIYGLGFGACVMMRTTNALPICCYALLAAIFLLKSGEVKILLKNFLNFCAGFAIICLPFVIYFAAHGALYDMLYGTILLNVVYSAQRENFLLNHLDDYGSYVLMHFMPLYLMLAVGAIELFKTKSRLAISGIFCSAAMLVMLFKLSPYMGYCALIVPLFPIFFALLAESAKNFHSLWAVEGLSPKKFLCKFLIVTAMTYPLIISYETADKFATENSAKMRRYHLNQNAEMPRLAEIIPPEERGSVMIWGEGLQMSHWILTTGIFPRCRFFGNIKAFANVDPNVKREWLDVTRANPPKWIIYSAPAMEFRGEEMISWEKFFRTNRNADVEQLLQEKYILVDGMESYVDSLLLYRLKD